MKLKSICSRKIKTTFLANNIKSQDVNIELVDTSILPKAPNLLCLGTGKNTEIILYNKIEGNFILDCIRGFKGKARSWDKMTVISNTIINSDFNIDNLNIDTIPNNSITADKIKDITELSPSVIIGNGADYIVYKDDNGEEIIESTTIVGEYAEASTYYATSFGRSAKAMGSYSIALGDAAKAISKNSSAIGDSTRVTYDYSTVIGYYSTAISSNQIMLGRPSDTPYAYNPLVVISDKRDKTSIRDINFNSLDFLNKLKPKQYKMDCRSNYKIEKEITKEEYEKLDEQVKRAHTTKYTIYELENEIKYINYKNHDNKSDKSNPILKTKGIFLSKPLAIKYLIKNKNYKNIDDLKEKEVGEIILKEVFLESDGSKAGERYHNGFLAQEVEEVAKSMNFDFAGVKNLAHDGNGEDIYGLSYEEFIAPIVSGIQELSKENNNLKSELNMLKTKNIELENRNNKLENENIELNIKLNKLENKLNYIIKKLEN